MELLALTAAAVRPLLRDGDSSDSEPAWLHMEDESPGSWAPNHSVFSPLIGRGSPHHVTPPGNDTPTPPDNHSDHTPSPLTITARDNSFSSWDSQSLLTHPAFRSRSTPQHSATSTPSMVTPLRGTPHHTPHSKGHVRIKISAKKVREVASPLLTPPPPKPPQKSENEEVSLGSLPSCDSHVTSECSTPRALVLQPPPQSLSLSPSPSSLSPVSPPGVPHPPLQARIETSSHTTNIPSNANGVKGTNKSKSLVQGMMKFSHHSSPVNTSLENSVQIESPRPTSAAKEKLFQQQAREKKLVQFKVIQPQVIGQHEPTGTRTNLGGNEGGEPGHETGRASPGPPQKARRVGGDRNRGSCRIPLHEAVTSKSQERPGAGMTRLPASPIPPHPRHPTPSQLDSEPDTSVFLENTAHERDSASPPRKTLGRRAPAGPPPIGGRHVTNTTGWHHRRNHRRRPHVSSSRNQEPGVISRAVTSGGGGASVISGLRDGVSLSKSSAQPPPPTPTSSSFPPHPPHLPGNPSLHPPFSNSLPLNFEETVCLVASCAAAATAAALTAQRNTGDEASVMKDRLGGNCLSHHLAPRHPPSKLDFPPLPPVSTEEAGGGERTRRRGRGSEAPRRGPTISVKEPPMEKKTEVFTVAPLESQSYGGVGPVDKQPSPLSNQILGAGKHSEKTQNGTEFMRQHPQGAFPSPSHRLAGLETNTNSEEGSSPGTSQSDLIAGDEGAVSPTEHQAEKPRRCSLTTQKEWDLLRVERAFLGIQQARRDLEAREALADLRASWSDPPPPIPSDEDPTHLGVPKYRVARLLNQLKDGSTSGQEDREEKPPPPVEESSVKASRKVAVAGGNKAEKTKKKSSTRGKREGKLCQDRGKTKERVDEEKEEETNTQTEQGEKTHVTLVPPTAPLRVLPMGPPGGVPLGGYTLGPHPGGAGVVVCDPSTGVPLVGFSSAGVPPAPGGVGGAQIVLPIPPCIQMPTAIPLGHTLGTPTAPPPPPPPVPVSATDQQDGEGEEDGTGGPSVADVGLQTSFTETPQPKTPQLVREVLPSLDISTSQSTDSTPAKHPVAHTDDDIEPLGISLPGNHTGSSPPDVEDNTSPPPPHRPVNRHFEREVGEDLSAERISHKVAEYLENEGTEWATRELLTRVLAAARDRSHEESCDQNPGHRLVDSPNSCSTCTLSPPSLSRRHITSVPPHTTDITTMAGGSGDVWNSVWGGGGGEGGMWEGARCAGVRGDVVEAVVREVLREKVSEALRELQSGHRQEEEERDERQDRGEKTDVAGYEKEESVDSPRSSLQIPTPPPSPPPPAPLSLPPLPPSPPPPEEDNDSSSLNSSLATPTATPSISHKSESTETSPHTRISTPQETEEDTTATTPGGVAETPTSYSGDDSKELHPLTTPTSSPPHQAPPTPTPPSPTESNDEPTPTPSQPPPKQLSLSESSSPSSSSTSTTGTEVHPPHPHSLSTVTNLTTDQEISTGECLVQRPPMLPAGDATSQSEGEAPLSPGDAHWYSTYATKMGQWAASDNQRSNKRKRMSPAVTAFLELKNSPDSLSDSSGHSSSFQSDLLSEGEVRGKERRGDGDPLDRFVAHLQSSPGHTSPSPSSSSSTPLTSCSSRDNTLSDVASVIPRDSGENSRLSRGEVREGGERNSTPLKPTGKGGDRGGNRWTQFKETGEIVGSQKLPYHRKFPLEQNKSASPGEARAKDLGQGKKSDLSVSFSRSVGELNPVVCEHRREKAAQQQAGLEAASSPGEIRLRHNKTRDGIDIIRISHQSSPTTSHSQRDPRRLPQETTAASLSFPSSLSDSPAITQPQQDPTVRRRLRVSSELGPPQVITVSPAVLPTLNDGKKGEDDAMSKQTIPESKSNTSSIGHEAGKEDLTEQDGGAEAQEDVSPDATRPPPLEIFLSPSPSPPPPPSPQTTPPSSPPPPTSHTLETKARQLQPQGSSSDTPRSFWDTELHQPSPTTAMERVGSPGGGRTQLQVSVPTGGTITSSLGEESPPLSPAYSSDFEFSSISQPTFD